VSIGIATVAYGQKYRDFLPYWIWAVQCLNTQPDEILIVTDDVGDARRAVGDHRATIVHTEGSHKHHPQKYLDPAIRRLETDWVCKMDVDDLIRPHAFDRLATAHCDVWMFGIHYQNHDLHAPHITAEDILRLEANLVFSGSPYRKWLLTEASYRDMIYEDWAFWVDCAKQNARFQPSGTIDYDYVMHTDNISTHANDGYWQSVVRSIA
jgi:hypothetical protein